MHSRHIWKQKCHVRGADISEVVRCIEMADTMSAYKIARLVAHSSSCPLVSRLRLSARGGSAQSLRLKSASRQCSAYAAGMTSLCQGIHCLLRFDWLSEKHPASRLYVKRSFKCHAMQNMHDISMRWQSHQAHKGSARSSR